MHRRNFIKAGAALTMLNRLGVWEKRKMFRLTIGIATTSVQDQQCRPVRWACAQPVNADGSLMIQLIRSDDKRWRKGV